MQKKKRLIDKKYLEWIRGIPCIVCSLQAGEVPVINISASEAHHVPEKGNASIGMKTSDRRAIQMCAEHHMEYHNIGRETFAEKYDLDYEEIISELNGIYKRMVEVRHSKDH